LEENMSNAIYPARELEIAGERFRIAFDYEAIARAEDLTDQPLLTGLSLKQIKTPKINFVRAMFFAALLREHPEMTYQRAAALVAKDTLSQIWVEIVGAWMDAQRQDEESKAADPRPGQS
jgi:hypothetical protein